MFFCREIGTVSLTGIWSSLPLVENVSLNFLIAGVVVGCLFNLGSFFSKITSKLEFTFSITSSKGSNLFGGFAHAFCSSIDKKRIRAGNSPLIRLWKVLEVYGLIKSSPEKSRHIS